MIIHAKSEMRGLMFLDYKISVTYLCLYKLNKYTTKEEKERKIDTDAHIVKLQDYLGMDVINILTRRMPLVGHELLTLPEHPSRLVCDMCY